MTAIPDMACIPVSNRVVLAWIIAGCVLNCAVWFAAGWLACANLDAIKHWIGE